jgi:hypothetical protein
VNDTTEAPPECMGATHSPGKNLRFVLRGGKRILQQMFYPNDWATHNEEWRDIELRDEESNLPISG